ncbi:MAG: T9SS type A sorting domain-containing protein [Bacteroidota bacterium]
MKPIKNLLLIIILSSILLNNIRFSYCQTKIDTISGFYVKLKLETTSDWTKITFDSLSSSYYLTNDTILGPLTYYYDYFGVSRPDTAYTAVEYQLFYPVLPANGISISCTKGSWGITTLTVTISCGGNDTSLSFQNTIVAGDPLNTLAINFPSSFFQCINEETLLLSSPAACPLMLAFYYPWYGSPTGPTGYWVQWDPGEPDYNAPDTPSLGYYDSYDYDVIAQHISWAKQSGINGFVCSWWGIGDFTDGAIQCVFQVADTSSFFLSLYYEPGNIGSLPDSARTQRCINDITYLVNTYGSHPSMLHFNGKPVLFIYGQTLGFLNLEQWQQVISAIAPLNCVIVADRFAPGILQLFDGWHQYNPVFLSYNDLYRINCIAGGRSNLSDKIFAATASPGFITVPRQNGNKYNEQLLASLAYMPHYILITSFNEWGEASEIEPSLVYGYDYISYTAVFRDYLDSLCTAISSIQQLQTPEQSMLFVYPNPSSGKFIIELDNIKGVMENGVIEIYNVFGERIFMSPISLPKSEISLNLSGGIYFYQIRNEQQLIGNGKFIIQ